MATTQTQDTDREDAARAAYKSAGERVTRDAAKVKELQQIGRMIVDYVSGTRGVDQLANLKVLVAVKPGPDTNLFNLESSIRDAGWAAIRSYLEKAQPDFDKAPTEEGVEEWSQDQRVCGLLHNALALNGDENGIARVKAAIKRLEGH